MASLKSLMMLCILLVVFCLLLSVDAARARLCGRKLVNMLKKLCNHQYWYPSSSHQRRRSRVYSGGGIVDACCLKTCSYSYLKSYCAGTPVPTLPTTTLSLRTTRAARLATGYNSASKKQVTPMKTFRSLFHLLYTISGFLEKELKQNDNRVPAKKIAPDLLSFANE